MISWVNEEQENMSDKRFFEQALSAKLYSSQKLKKLIILIAPTSVHIERFTGRDNDWSIKNNDWPIQKI